MGKINFKKYSIKGIWKPQEIGFVDSTALRIVKLKGDYKWHRHKKEDEFFLVVKGLIFIDTEKEIVELKEWEGYLVKAGLKHRSRAPEVATVLVIEPIKTKTMGEE
ncbi:cupin domain-containing protein [candidate division WOR-3 bacterium]|nr:cupin domain-containing protein [candidate division WOR-3 bacterium]